jgi:hypothetical protein
MSGQSQPSHLTLPPAFPDDLFDKVRGRAAAKATGSSAAEHLAGSYNGVRYRLKASADYSEEFTHSFNTFGSETSLIERYRQERALFGFFVSGYSVLDSFSFFMYTAAAQIDPTHFPMQKPGHLQRISCKTIPGKFAKAFPGEEIATELARLIADPKFEEWDRLRNILAHRAAYGRAIHVSDVPAVWKIDPAADLKIDANLTQSRLAWLVDTLAKLVAAADVFTKTHF